MRAHTTPMVVTALGGEDQRCTALERLPLGSRPGETLYDELWLQLLIHRHPNLLPADQIEPALTPLVSICMELPTPSGFVDNLLLTPDGGVVLVEAKLWRNPQARREVVGQVLDYAKDLSRWSYEDLQKAARIASRQPTLDLFRHVSGSEADSVDEARFVDAVSRNLRLGRLLLIIAGDGIQESAEQLADFLQRHVGLHFTLSLVEISLWRAPETGQVFVQPKVLARTVQIERAVVRLEQGVAFEPVQLAPASPNARPTTISAETFYEALKAADPGLPDRLQAFLAEVEPLGVYPEIKRNMSLKWKAADGREFHLGLIDLQGRLGTDWAHAAALGIGRPDLSHTYEAKLAQAVPGATVRKTPKESSWRVVLGDQNVPVAALLDNKSVWIKAISDYIDEVRQALEPAETV